VAAGKQAVPTVEGRVRSGRNSLKWQSLFHWPKQRTIKIEFYI
jgi:hypothetical protein